MKKKFNTLFELILTIAIAWGFVYAVYYVTIHYIMTR